jgi:hypothetical protein
MTEAWTAPQVERTEPGLILGERQALEAWLDFHRDTSVRGSLSSGSGEFSDVSGNLVLSWGSCYGWCWYGVGALAARAG